jgi:K+-transporting ATPase ATPase B chain
VWIFLAVAFIRKGAGDAISGMSNRLAAWCRNELEARVEQVARGGATPLVVSDGKHVLGVVELSDVVKHGIKENASRACARWASAP